MNDGLDVPKFNSTTNKQKVTVKVKNISPRVYKSKFNYKVIKTAIVGMTAIVGFTAMMTARSGEEIVSHRGDTGVTQSTIQHWHELTKEDFMRDFLYLNPGASDQDIIEALQNGEYEYYIENNGTIKVHPSLNVFQFAKNSPERYENEVVPRVDEIMEENNIEETHGKTK